MFTAWLRICLLVGPESWDYFDVVDTRGPYYSHERYLERTEEMVTDIEDHHDVLGWKYLNRCAEDEVGI